MDEPKSTWRLLLMPPASGAWNMAVDEAILESCGKKETLPTLRLYAWDPPCLSLGFSQPVSDVDRSRLNALGWDLVRRPTGGRAILHTDEITYAVIGPEDEPRLDGGVLESYRRLSFALLFALRYLGVPAETSDKATNRSEGSQENPVCFEVPSTFEITIAGKKIIGSAQARRQNGVLQHGSLPLHGDLTRITDALSFPDDARRRTAADRLLERATTLETALEYRIDMENAAQALIKGFQSGLNLELVPGCMTAQEGNRAYELFRSKYTDSSWTEKY
jgi:lipoyl(octanoyl) transferase